MKIRTPDYVTLRLEKDTLDLSKEGNERASVRFELNGDALKVLLKANEGVRAITLRWKGKAREGVKILGDAWERGYGDLEWRGIVPDRHMPWYMAVSNGSDMVTDYSGRLTECFGVGVQPGALCMWKYDSEG
ncbi:MAG: hypothetical protein J6A54_04115, partial [Clostridia bacterium]|nr:hypothetical protein [Clostridia bacterium]